jgi:hypothetical protein
VVMASHTNGPNPVRHASATNAAASSVVGGCGSGTGAAGLIACRVGLTHNQPHRIALSNAPLIR